MPQFQEHFGEKQSDGTYQISAAWQAGLTNGRTVAQFFGLIINGWVSEKYGYRWTVIVCLTLIAAWTSIYFTANTLVEVLVASILSGIVSLKSLVCLLDIADMTQPWGIFQTLTITYASEVRRCAGLGVLISATDCIAFI